jgi:hypothetical protein
MLGHLYERALDGERCWIRMTGIHLIGERIVAVS